MGQIITQRSLTEAEATTLSQAIRETANILGYLPRELSKQPVAFVAEVDGAFAGACVVKRLSSRWSEIGVVLVLPPFRRRGIGSALFEQAFTYLQGENRRVLCTSREPSVLRLMESAGMRFIKEWQLPFAVHVALMRHYSSVYRFKEARRKMPMYKGQPPFRSAISP
jgi:GNAT superfamily N-acetyltransferase